jgi:hypothetical protein
VVIAVGTEDPAPAPGPQRVHRATFGAAFLAICVVNGLVAWFVPRVDRPIWLASLIVLGIDALAVAAIVTAGQDFGLARSARALLSAGLVVVGVAAAYAAWSLVLPAKIGGDAGAARVAEHLLAQPASNTCESSPRGLDTVGSLLAAKEVCVYGTGSHRFVEFIGRAEPARNVDQGLLFSRSGVSSYQDPDLCVRHLDGPWWQYEQLILDCPLGFTGIGAA